VRILKGFSFWVFVDAGRPEDPDIGGGTAQPYWATSGLHSLEPADVACCDKGSEKTVAGLNISDEDRQLRERRHAP
jgi:hypothetical protein